MPTSSEFLGFELVRKGYDRQQVDHYLVALLGSAAPADPLTKAEPPVGPPAFDIARRGYHRGQVDARIKELLAARGLTG